jgi:hypothetical protein
MRHLLVLAALFVGAAPAAASDRYGEARGAPAADQTQQQVGGRTLSWANKTAAQAGAPVAYAAPEPLALAGQYMRGRTSGGSRLDNLPPPPGQPQRTASVYASGYQPFTPQEPYRPQAAPRPVTVQAPPALAAPAPVTAAPSLPTSLYSPPPADAAIGRPQQIAEAASPTAPATAGVGEGSRLYSVHRGYGLAPDAIPTPQGDNYVLIGPPDSGSPDAGLAGGPPTDDNDEPNDGRPY